MRLAQLVLPFVRDDPRDADAWWQCGLHVGAYDFAGHTRNATPRDLSLECGTLCRALQAELLACVRRAYPGTTVPSTYHAAQLWTSFTRGDLDRQLAVRGCSSRCVATSGGLAADAWQRRRERAYFERGELVAKARAAP